MRTHAGVAELAGRQHGVVSNRQLAELGFSAAAVSRACRAKRLHPVHRGAYAVGHTALSDRARCLAAVLAAGDGAVLSHGAAGWLLGLNGHLTEVHVIGPVTRHRRDGFRVHRCLPLVESEITVLDRIPTTSVSRCLLDIASEGSRWTLNDAVERAEKLDLLHLDEIDSPLHRRRGWRGIGRLRHAVEIYRDPIFSRARSERLFLDLIKKAGLPRPAMNSFVAGMEIDAYWANERFAVEIDGWNSHRTRQAFERDPVRQEELKLAGIDSIRVTARRIEQEPRQIASSLSQLLTRSRQDPTHRG